MKITCVYVFVLIARTLAEDDAPACCSPGLFVAKTTTSCWIPGSNYTEEPKLKCTSALIPVTNIVLNESQLVLPGYDESGSSIDIFVPAYSFCIGNLTNKKKTLNIQRAFFCPIEKEVEYHGYLMIVSVLCLTLTIIIYSSLSELRNNLQGKSYINLCLSLAVGLLLLVIIRLMHTNYGNMSLCAARGFLGYFFLMASFFWTSSISFQVFLSVRNPVAVTERGWNKFIRYAAFSWGMPLILSIIMLIINYHPSLPIHVKAGIGHQHCWFFDNQQWYYMYSVMIIILSFNILMFSYSAFVLWRHTFSSSQISSLKYKFSQTCKLVVVMGILWIIEIIVNTEYAKDSTFWNVLSVVVSLEGVWIFLVLVVFRKKVIRAVHKRGWLFCFSGIVENRCLAAGDEVDDDVIEHTAVPMNET